MISLHQQDGKNDEQDVQCVFENVSKDEMHNSSFIVVNYINLFQINSTGNFKNSILDLVFVCDFSGIVVECGYLCDAYDSVLEMLVSFGEGFMELDFNEIKYYYKHGNFIMLE